MSPYEVLSLFVGSGVIGLLLDIKFKLGTLVSSHDDHERRLDKLENKSC
jgi:hypothetical protein